MVESIDRLATIAIPTFNRAKLLPRAVVSALAQDYPSVEVLIVDNASTDETEDICRALVDQHRHIQYMRQPFNTGPVNNFETGLRKARGYYFMWLADDDIITNNYLRRCIEELERGGHAIVAGQDWWYAGDDDESKPVLTGVPYRQPGGGVVPAPIVTVFQAEPKSRVLAYVRSVDSNAAIYGVCRTETARALLPIRSCIGWDWLWVLGLVSTGTLGVATDAGIRRNAEGISAQWQRAGAQLGHGKLGQCYPRILLSFEMLRTCSQRLPTGTSILDREVPAAKAAIITWVRLGAIGDLTAPIRSLLHRVIPRSVSGSVHAVLRSFYRPIRSRLSPIGSRILDRLSN